MLVRAGAVAAILAIFAAGGLLAKGAPRAELRTSTPSGIEIAAVGDVMLDRGVEQYMDERGDDWPFSATSEMLREADIAFANLETSVTDGGRKFPGKGIWFRMDPTDLSVIKEAGIDIVSAANNHIMDYDESSLKDTLRHLSSSGIRYVGAGMDLKSARMGKIMRVGGLSVGFLAYSDFYDIFWSFDYPRTLAAGESRPGMAPAIEGFMQEDIRRIKAHADFVVVSVHWGQEYMEMPDSSQIQRAHAAIDAGADVVLGHHPHVLQPIESYNGGLIFYSLGNFVFDQSFGKTADSALAMIRLRYGMPPEAEVIPLRIGEGRPAPVSAVESLARSLELRSRSLRLGTSMFIKHGSIFVTAGEGRPQLLSKLILSESLALPNMP